VVVLTVSRLVVVMMPTRAVMPPAVAIDIRPTVVGRSLRRPHLTRVKANVKVLAGAAAVMLLVVTVVAALLLVTQLRLGRSPTITIAIAATEIALPRLVPARRPPL
jgi:hypothetical protein